MRATSDIGQVYLSRQHRACVSPATGDGFASTSGFAALCGDGEMRAPSRLQRLFAAPSCERPARYAMKAAAMGAAFPGAQADRQGCAIGSCAPRVGFFYSVSYSAAMK